MCPRFESFSCKGNPARRSGLPGPVYVQTRPLSDRRSRRTQSVHCCIRIRAKVCNFQSLPVTELICHSSEISLVHRICPARFLALSSTWAAIATILAVFKVMKAVDENGKVIEPHYRFVPSLLLFVLNPYSAHANSLKTCFPVVCQSRSLAHSKFGQKLRNACSMRFQSRDLYSVSVTLMTYGFDCK